MKKAVLASTILLTSLSFGSVAYACDMHGGGYGFGMKNANWQTYNSRVSNTDPALGFDEMQTSANPYSAPQGKAKPSFANAASTAALKAKVRMEKKAELKTTDASEKTDKSDKKKPEKKPL